MSGVTSVPKSATARACSSSHAFVTRLKNSSGKMYALKSEGSTGPRRLLAAAHRRLSSSCWLRPDSCAMPTSLRRLDGDECSDASGARDGGYSPGRYRLELSVNT